MKDFNPYIKCPKCGCDEINTCYMEKLKYSSCGDHLREYKEDGSPVLKEHLRRECLRCHFGWPENIAKETKINSGLVNRMPFRIEGSLEGGPDIIIVDRNGKDVGDLYITKEEAKEIVDIINKGLI